MKWFLCLYICVLHYTVHGARSNKPNRVKEIISLEVDSNEVIYGPDQNFMEEGTEKRISCKGSHKQQKIEWYDPQGRIVTLKSQPPKEARVYVEPTPSRALSMDLVLSHAMAEDSGVWECRSGELIQQLSLCIIAPAEIAEKSETETKEEGRSITLVCEARGNPEPTVSWLRDGQLLVEDKQKYRTSVKYKSHSHEGLLTIMSLGPDDMGVYTCEAKQVNPKVEECSFTVSTNTTLNVNHAPRFDNDDAINIMFVQEGENVTFVCQPSAYPKPNFRWFTSDMSKELTKLAKLSDDGTQSNLTVTANSFTYNHKYQCRADNEFGFSDIIYQIKKLQKPDQINAETRFDAWTRTLYFNISYKEDVPFPVDGFEIEYLEKTFRGVPDEEEWINAKTRNVIADDMLGWDEENCCEIPLNNLKINTEYWNRIRAYNEMGEGSWSNLILASTDYEFDVAIETEGFDRGVLIGMIVTAVIIAFAAGCIIVIKKL